jgi:uncharacterized protein (TIGR02598 family)
MKINIMLSGVKYVCNRSALSGCCRGHGGRAPRLRSPKGTAGFTLVEVTIALAVVMIGLMAVLGMVANGLRSSRSAVDNCVPAMIANDVFSQVKAEFHSYVEGRDLSSIRTPEVSYHNIEGISTNEAFSYYKGRIVYRNVPGLHGGSAVNDNVVQVLLEVTWPFPTYQSTNIFITNVARLWTP